MEAGDPEDGQQDPPRRLSSIHGGPAADAEEIMAEIRAMKNTLRGHSHCIINPRTDKWIQYWDAVSFMALLFTATVTPFEVSLLPSTTLVRLGNNPREFGLFITNRLVDLFFSIDMVLNFFMAYQEAAYKGGMWVTHRGKIARTYLRSWFVIDVISVMPFDVLTRLREKEDETDLAILRTFRFIRLMRLIKLLRILRASRIIARWQNFIGISYAQMTMIKFMTTTFFLVHFMACTWAYVGLNWEPTPGSTLDWESTWLDHYGFVNSSNANNAQNLAVGPHRLYFISLYVAVCSMFGSVGSISPRNYAEYMVITLMMLVGSMVWAWVIGSLCGILATLNPHGTAFQNLMDELNFFMRTNNFQSEHRVRLREFFRQTQDFNRIQSYDKLLLKMSAQLRGDTALFIGTATLEKIWYYLGIEKKALIAASLPAITAYPKRRWTPYTQVLLRRLARGRAAVPLARRPQPSRRNCPRPQTLKPSNSVASDRPWPQTLQVKRPWMASP